MSGWLATPQYSIIRPLRSVGGQNYEEAVNFIKMKFSELNQHPDKKTIYMHETCATDTNQVNSESHLQELWQYVGKASSKA